MAIFLPPYSKKHIFILGGITVLASLFLLALNSFSPSLPLGNSANSVSAQELKQDFDEAFIELKNDNAVGAILANNLLIIDLRSSDEYQAGHITGAENLQPADLKGSLFSDDLNIVLYGNDSKVIDEARQILSEHEIASVKVLQEDISTLEEQGYPITRQP